MIAVTANEREAADFAKIMGTDDKTVTMLRISVEGGAKLTGKVTMNVRFLPKLLMVRGGGAAVPPPINPPPPVIK